MKLKNEQRQKNEKKERKKKDWKRKQKQYQHTEIRRMRKENIFVFHTFVQKFIIISDILFILLGVFLSFSFTSSFNRRQCVVSSPRMAIHSRTKEEKSRVSVAILRGVGKF